MTILSLALSAGSGHATEAAGTAPPQATELDSVRVSGRALMLYKSDDAAVATRTDTAPALMPLSVQVLPRELMDDQAARQVTDLYRSISGISFFSYAGVTLRGFRQENVLYDGLRGDPYAGFAVPQLFNIERVEVLKGPTGALYGGGDAGGVINYVTRKPQANARRQVTLQAGNANFIAGSIEITGPLNQVGSVRTRLGIHADSEEEAIRWNSDQESLIADASIAMDVGQTGELTLQYTDITQNLGGNRLRGVSVNDHGHLLTSRRWNHNEASDFLDMRARIMLAQYRVSPSPAWDADMAVRWFENNEHQIYHEPMGLIDRDHDGFAEWMTRELRNQFRNNETLAANGNVVWRFSAATSEHKLLFGIDYSREDAAFRAQTANSANRAGTPGAVPGIDLRHPVYGTSGWYDYNLPALPWRFTDTRLLRHGAYVQDEMSVTPRWHVLTGLRWDRFEADDRIAGRRIRGHDLSWRVGSTFVLREGIHLYANRASGFVPQSAASQNPVAGGPFAPEQSRQWEAGLKSLLSERITLNTAVYRIERRNIVQATGESISGVNQLAALGLVRSKGVELDILADVSAHWVVNLTYAWNDTRVIDAGTNGITNAFGGRFANAPRNQLGLWTRLDLPQAASAVGFGLDYTDERISLDGQRVKPYVIYDVSWQTRWRDWKFQVNIKNMFDKVYAASGFATRQGHFPGEPRRLYVQAAYDF